MKKKNGWCKQVIKRRESKEKISENRKKRKEKLSLKNFVYFTQQKNTFHVRGKY